MQNQQGQTLIEIILAVGLVVLVLTSVAGGVAISVRNNRFARTQEEAKQYSRETSEWFRRMRDQLGWDTFAGSIRTDGNSPSYCLPTLPQTPTAFVNLTSRTCGESEVIANTPFTRSVALTTDRNPPDLVTAVITVAWSEGTKTFSSQTTTTLRRWR